MEENQRRKQNNQYNPEQSNKKKSYPKRNLYACYCSKSYSSFPALYLHCKNSHNRLIAYKNLRSVGTQWSGNVKYEYFQFQENYQDGRDPIEENSNNQGPQQIIRRGPIPAPQNQSPKPRREKKKTTTLLTNCEDNILQVFEKYQSMMKSSENSAVSAKQRQQLLQKLSQFMNREYRNVEEQIFQNYCLQSSTNNVVLFFNPFYLQMLEKQRPLNNFEMKELNNLSKWLVFYDYSSNCALLEEEYRLKFDK